MHDTAANPPPEPPPPDHSHQPALEPPPIDHPPHHSPHHPLHHPSHPPPYESPLDDPGSDPALQQPLLPPDQHQQLLRDYETFQREQQTGRSRASDEEDDERIHVYYMPSVVQVLVATGAGVLILWIVREILWFREREGWPP